MSRFSVFAVLFIFFLVSTDSFPTFKPLKSLKKLTKIPSKIISKIKPKNLAGSVDCLGFSNLLAKGLETLFQAKPNGTNALDVKFTISSNQWPERVGVELGVQYGPEWTYYDIRKPTKVIVHGFLSSGEEEWVKEMERAFHVMVNLIKTHNVANIFFKKKNKIK